MTRTTLPISDPQPQEKGFSLIELLVAATIFTFVVTGVTGLFLQALDLQRRASGIQKIEENAQFLIESIAREIRVSRITSSDSICTPPDPATTRTLVIEHPVNGTITYTYAKVGGVGAVMRDDGSGPQQVTAKDVDLTAFAFCVTGSGPGGKQARVTIPMTLRSTAGRAGAQVSVSLQTTIVARDLSQDIVP
ncbi:MAG: prepilin-type N-terminal cleavage/methylation domain-containing protein [Candidatus Yanofskybacteria bacterium]|nr:prepilin-type N-terminal cleavage/methylation domain-containing protein [Candidatus Yanofskybacteria bacterium]